MSMHRQIWLAIVITALIAFGGGLVSSVINAKTYLESQLSQKNTDNAHALALSISHSSPNQANTEVAVNAMFDSGHYEFIEIQDPEKKVIAERHADEDNKVKHAQYQYLEKLVPIRPIIGNAEINDGWKQFGTVYVSSSSEFAYAALYRTVFESCLAMLAAGLLSALLSYIILSRFTKTLDDVVAQVSASSKQDFFTIPNTKIPELRKLTKAVNNTAHRLKEAFDQEAQKLETMRKKACTDPLTGIANREFFLSILENATQNDMPDGGILVLLRIEHLAELNEKIGRVACDQLIQAITQVLNSYAIGNDFAFTGRLNGSDFALLMPNLTKKNTEVSKSILDKVILENTRQIAHKWIDPTAYLFTGVTTFKHEASVSEILKKADKALSAAIGKAD